MLFFLTFNIHLWSCRNYSGYIGIFFYVHLASYLSALFLVLDQTVNSLFYITSESTTMPKRAAKVAGIYQQSYKRTF